MRNSRTNAQLTSDQSIWPLASNQINQRQFNSWCCIYSLSLQSLATPVSLARTLLCFYFFLVLLFKSNFRTAYGIWIVVLWLCLKQFICSIVYVWYTQSERPAHCCSCHLKYDEKRRKKAHTHSWYFRDLYAIIYYILCSVQENDSEKRYIAGLLVFFRLLLLSGCILIILPSFSLCACVCAYAFVQFHIDVLVFWS